MKFILNDAKVRADCIEHILNIDVSKKPIQTCTIANFKKDRSTAQNRYYWSVVLGMFSDATGYSVDELHETLKFQLLPTKIVTIGSVRKEVSTSTASLTTTQFEDYCEDIRRFAAETIGLVIPDPNQAGMY